METLPFASNPAPHSVWGCSSISNNPDTRQIPSFQTTPTVRSNGHPNPSVAKMESRSSPEENYPSSNYEYMPAVLLNSLKRDKKPFTYTPGRLDLSEVLNDKLRKRMERRKKRAEDRSLPQSPVQDEPILESPKQVLVMPTYNSPLNMYSMENALEALEVQAEITVADKSFSPQSRSQSMTLPRNYKFEQVDYEPKNVTQSKAFRVLQIITDTEEGEGGQNGPTNNPENDRDEMMFSGTRTSDVIPSKFFHNLQRITGTEGQESSNVPSQPGHKVNTEHYHDEMRFSGTRPNATIPSKLFHNLQRITGTEDQISNGTHQKGSGPVNASNTGVWEIQFRPKEDMLRQVKNTLHMSQTVRPTDNKTSIPVLQRPAAFLPAKQSVTKHVSCCPRFTTNISNAHSFGGTNF